MKIIILSQYFPPDRPGLIPDDVVRGLAERGHDVRVLTTFPHYGVEPSLRVKKRRKLVQTQDGITVLRIPTYANHSSKAHGRILNYLSFIVSARFAKKYVRAADVIYVHGTPATVAEPARAWSKSLGIPFVFHVQDIWPDSVTGSGFLPPWATIPADKIISRWLNKVYEEAHAILTISSSARNLLEERGVSPKKIRLSYNWSREEFSSRPVARTHQEGKFTLVYAGNLGRLQDLETVVHAANEVRDLSGFQLLIAGTGVVEDELKSLTKDLQADHFVKFLGQLNLEEIRDLYSIADFQIVPLKNLEIFRANIPSKVQSGLANGVPTITTVQGDVASLVEANRLGFTTSPENANKLAHTIRRAYATTLEERRGYSQRSRDFYDANFAKNEGLDRIEQALLQASLRRK